MLMSGGSRTVGGGVVAALDLQQMDVAGRYEGADRKGLGGRQRQPGQVVVDERHAMPGTVPRPKSSVGT